MVFNRQAFHQTANVASLILAIASLPFSVKICNWALILLTLNWIVEGQWKHKWKIMKTQPLLWAFIIFLVAHLFGLLYTEDEANGLFNIEKKMAFFFLPLIVATIHIRRKHVNFLLKSFVATCFIACIVCLGIAFYNAITGTSVPENFDLTSLKEFNALTSNSSAWLYFSYKELSSGINLHPTYLSVYILFSNIILIYFYKVEEDNITIQRKGGMIILFLFFSFFIMMLAARVVIIEYIIICPVALWFTFQKTKNSILSIAGIIAVVTICIICTVANPVSRYRSIEEFTSPFRIDQHKLYTRSSEIRFSLWWMGLQSINKNNWLFGEGTGDVKDVMKATSDTYGITNVINSYDPHNQFIYTTISLGIIGLAALLACMVLPLTQYASPTYLLSASLFGIVFITSLTESFFELQKGIVFFSIFNSLLVFQTPVPNVNR